MDKIYVLENRFHSTDLQLKSNKQLRMNFSDLETDKENFAKEIQTINLKRKTIEEEILVEIKNMEDNIKFYIQNLTENIQQFISDEVI